MQTREPDISLAELNLLLAAAARQSSAAEEARVMQRRVHDRLVHALAAVSSLVLLYDVTLVWAA